jgi:hypothetical protein
VKKYLGNILLILIISILLVGCGKVAQSSNGDTTYSGNMSAEDQEALKKIANASVSASNNQKNSTSDAQINSTSLSALGINANILVSSFFSNTDYPVGSPEYWNKDSYSLYCYESKATINGEAVFRYKDNFGVSIAPASANWNDINMESRYIVSGDLVKNDTYQIDRIQSTMSMVNLTSINILTTSTTNITTEFNSTINYASTTQNFIINNASISMNLTMEDSVTILPFSQNGTTNMVVRFSIPFQFSYSGNIYSGTFIVDLNETYDHNNMLPGLDMEPKLEGDIYKNGSKIGRARLTQHGEIEIWDNDGLKVI